MSAPISSSTLRDHWLVGIECDHEAKRDKPSCSCSLVDLGWHPSVGAAVDAWITHAASQEPYGKRGERRHRIRAFLSLVYKLTGHSYGRLKVKL